MAIVIAASVSQTVSPPLAVASADDPCRASRAAGDEYACPVRQFSPRCSNDRKWPTAAFGRWRRKAALRRNARLSIVRFGRTLGTAALSQLLPVMPLRVHVWNDRV